MNRKRLLLLVAVLLPGAIAAAHAQKPQSFPTKPIRLLVPAPPGGSSDLIARLVGAQLATQLGQQVVIDNRGGAGGVVATEMLGQGSEIVGNTPQEFRDFIRNDIVKWAKLVKAAGIKID